MTQRAGSPQAAPGSVIGPVAAFRPYESEQAVEREGGGNPVGEGEYEGREWPDMAERRRADHGEEDAAREPVTWYQQARAYAEVKWPNLAPVSRRSVAGHDHGLRRRVVARNEGTALSHIE